MLMWCWIIEAFEDENAQITMVLWNIPQQQLQEKLYIVKLSSQQVGASILTQ